MDTIFVQIASYRDPQLLPTLADMLDNASFPQNLHICICWQHGDDEGLDDFLDAGFDISDFTDDDNPVISATYRGAKVSIIDVPFYDSQGACWARHAIQQHYAGEKYTLQLDSHHRFVEGWDAKCVEMVEALRYKSPKPLLTAYIPSFDPINDPKGRVMAPWKMDFDRFIPEGAVFFLPSTIDEWKDLSEPMRGRFYSAHFAFADGSFATEVQHDPEYFFHGEEISIAARAYTHGYDIYHPHILIAWHEYTRNGRTKVWDDHTTEKKKQGKIKLDWVQRNDMCHRRNRILFGMDGEDPAQIDFGRYGFGAIRTLDEYEKYAGICFRYRAVTQDTLARLEPAEVSMVYADETEWREALIGSHDVHICIHKNDLGELVDDFDCWYVGVHDDAEDGNTEIDRRDLLPADIKKYLKGEWVDYRYVFLSNRKPTHYIFWTHSASREWMHKVERRI